MEELVNYLAAYGTTPHTVTGVCTAELLFGQKIGTKITELREATVNDDGLRGGNWEKKIKRRHAYADE